MKLNTSCCLKFNNPCKKIVKLFKFKLRKPLFINRLRFFRPSIKCESNTSTRRKQASQVLSVFRSIRRSKPREEDQVMALKSFSGNIKAPVPSPITPAYARLSGATKKEVVIFQDDVEDACRSFENYLAEMIVEEGKMRDIMDVEELLYCWKNLKSPVFIDLVCRFYGELCKDLFSNTNKDDINSPQKIMQ